jgi:capsular exopolysaccharide synthesis family protein
VKVEPVRDTNLFAISVRDFSPLGAAVLANVVSRSYIIFDLEQQLAELALKYGEKHQAYLQLKDYIDAMTKNLTGEPLPNIEAIGPASVKVVEQAQIPFSPVGPSKIMILLLAFFMSIFLGVMLAFAFEYMDQSFKSPAEVETYLNMPCLGSVPVNSTPSNYHALADQIYLVLKDRSLKTLMITAALPKEGVTATVTHLGTYLSKTANHKVLIVDANIRTPNVYHFANAHEGMGLAEFLEEKAPFDNVVKEIGHGLYVLPAGRTQLNPITLLGSKRLQDGLKLAKERFDIVLIDSPELLDYKDAAVLSSAVDAVAVVVTEGKTRKQVVKAGLEPLVEKKANLIGAILNNRSYVIPKLIYDRI